MPVLRIPSTPRHGHFRVGAMNGLPFAALISAKRAVLMDIRDGNVLFDIPASEDQTFLDLAIEPDGAWLMQRTGATVEVVRMLGDAHPTRYILLKGDGGGVDFPGALRVVKGSVHAILAPDPNELEILTYYGPGGAQPCLRESERRIGYADMLDLIATGSDPGGTALFAAHGSSAPPLVGGQMIGQADWSAAKLSVLAGELDQHGVPGAGGEDIWAGAFGGRQAIAFGSDSSIQVRDLIDGRLLGVRVTGDGGTWDDDARPDSVALCGDLVAIATAGSLVVRRWSDFATVQLVPHSVLPWPEGSRWLTRVRMVEAGPDVWLVASDGEHVWSQPVHFPRQFSTTRTPIPLSWRHLCVAPDGRLVAGIDPRGRVRACGDTQYASLQFIGVRRSADGSSGTFTMAEGEWSRVWLGWNPTTASHRAAVAREDAIVAGYSMYPTSLNDHSATHTEDPVTACSLDVGVVGHFSGAVTEAPDWSRGGLLWKEAGSVTHLVAPRLLSAAGVGKQAAPVVVVGVEVGAARFGRVVLRRPDGALLAEMATRWVAHLDAVWAGDELLIAVATRSPNMLMCLRWSAGSLAPVMRTMSVEVLSLALSATEEGAALAYVSGSWCHVIEPVTGTPLGDAPLPSGHAVMVDGPFGTRFLLSKEVRALTPRGGALAWRPPPLSPGDLVRPERPWLASHQALEGQVERA